MYHFISGYTAKVAGTEAGITEPQTIFLACFGEPFLPLHPTKYAELLGQNLKGDHGNVWPINTGWSGGAYVIGERIKFAYIRAMITAALDGKLDQVNYLKRNVFGAQMPTACPGVPSSLLNPKKTWNNPHKFDETAKKLTAQFNENFKIYESFANDEIRSGAPKLTVELEKG
jgi:phosphoenolpyruvate carboxykinase (ATP)